MITWTDVGNLDATLSSVAVSTQTLILSIVQRQVDDDAWGTFADDGRLFLAAHLGRLYGGPGAGFVTSETLGPMSRSYGLPPGVKGALSTTKWGIEYERLLRIAIGIAAFVP